MIERFARAVAQRARSAIAIVNSRVRESVRCLASVRARDLLVNEPRDRIVLVFVFVGVYCTLQIHTRTNKSCTL